jgi:hypothetical protein
MLHFHEGITKIKNGRVCGIKLHLCLVHCELETHHTIVAVLNINKFLAFIIFSISDTLSSSFICIFYNLYIEYTHINYIFCLDFLLLPAYYFEMLYSSLAHSQVLHNVTANFPT